ncbi:alanine racemase [Enterococcus olivae]
MAVSYHRPTKLIIDLQAIRQNIVNEIEHNQGKEVFVAVKANGYGHGAVPVAKAAIDGGAAGLCVATIDEAIELREQGVITPILLLGILDHSAIRLAQEYQIAVPVATMEWLEEARKLLQESPVKEPLKIHLVVDTGMGRIGFRQAVEVREAALFVDQEAYFEWEGIFTHFATADQEEDSYWQKQNQRFQEALAVLPRTPQYVHVSNSATSIWHEDLGNMVRYGIAMYGLNPAGREMMTTYPLKPALSLVSELIQVKKVPQGEGIGYGKTYETPNEEWIGTVPIGYADGYIRKMQGFHVLVAGHECEIVGRVCMDQLMIRLPQAFKAGTKVTLVGEDQGAVITLQDVADHLGTIHYEVACLFSERIPREYI